MTAETHVREERDFASLRFAVSCVLHMAREFPGASWHGEVEYMEHGEKMYRLAIHNDFEVRLVLRVQCVAHEMRGLRSYEDVPWCKSQEETDSWTSIENNMIPLVLTPLVGQGKNLAKGRVASFRSSNILMRAHRGYTK